MSYFPDNVDEIRDAINILEKAIAELDGGVSVNVDTLTGTGETGRAVMKAPTPAKARDAIGAGTSSLKLGSTATTAMPGNTPIADAVTVATIDGAGDTGREGGCINGRTPRRQGKRKPGRRCKPYLTN